MAAMRHALILCLFAFAGCESAASYHDDAGIPIPDGSVDAPPDATADASRDATADYEPDADEPLPWPYFLEGDECDLIAQNCLFAGHTCRREPLGGGEFGTAKCVDYGTLLTANPTPCNQTTNLCAKGLICLGARCLRPCDPDGDACPNTDHGNSPQTCVEASDYPQPYCEWWDI